MLFWRGDFWVGEGEGLLDVVAEAVVEDDEEDDERAHACAV